jgi:hypothetical protein
LKILREIEGRWKLANEHYKRRNSIVFKGLDKGLRQSKNLKMMAKLERYKMYGIDTSRDKPRDFDLVSLTS